jgi:uncharacterized protein (TIGR03067 family)
VKLVALTEGMVNAMFANKVKIVAAMLLLVGAMSTGIWFLGGGGLAIQAQEPKQPGQKAEKPAPKPPPEPADAAAAKEKFQGTWRCVTVEREGARIPDEQLASKDSFLIVKGDKMSWKVGDKTVGDEYAYKLDVTQTPKQLDQYHDAAGDTVIERGIYVLDGDELKICRSHPKFDRPTEFKTTAPGTTMFTFKREKPGQEKPTAEKKPDPATFPIEKRVQPGRIYFHRFLSDVGDGGANQLAAIDPDGKNEKDLPRRPVKEEGKVDLYSSQTARLSPDGKWLAYGDRVVEGNTVGPGKKIYLRDPDKKDRGEELVSSDDTIDSWAWSPDGKRLAFIAYDARNKRSRNWVVDVKTKKVEEIELPLMKTVKGDEYRPAIVDWTPDGEWFLVVGEGLHLVKADGSKTRRIEGIQADTVFAGIRLSPDGKKVLYVTRNFKDKAEGLFVLDVASGKSKALVEGMNVSEVRACWSPDGKRVAYQVTLLNDGKRAEETSLIVADAEGTNSSTILTEKHPDPRAIALVLTDWR